MHHFRTTFFIQRPSSSNGLDSENPKGGGRPLVRKPPTAFPSLLFRMPPSESAKRPPGPASVELPQVQDVVGPAPLALARVAPVELRALDDLVAQGEGQGQIVIGQLVG